MTLVIIDYVAGTLLLLTVIGATHALLSYVNDVGSDALKESGKRLAASSKKFMFFLALFVHVVVIHMMVDIGMVATPAMLILNYMSVCFMRYKAYQHDNKRRYL